MPRTKVTVTDYLPEEPLPPLRDGTILYRVQRWTIDASAELKRNPR